MGQNFDMEESFNSGSDPNVLAAAVAWVADLLTGTLATSACILAVAALGCLLLAGRVPIRRGLTVIIGCFIILSAHGIADAFMAYRPQEVSTSAEPSPSAKTPEPAKPPPAPAPYDPYGFTPPNQ